MTDLETTPKSIEEVLKNLNDIEETDKKVLYAYIGAIENENLAKQSRFMSDYTPRIDKDKLDTTIDELTMTI